VPITVAANNADTSSFFLNMFHSPQGLEGRRTQQVTFEYLRIRKKNKHLCVGMIATMARLQTSEKAAISRQPMTTNYVLRESDVRTR
jgi:hypothetical protein